MPENVSFLKLRKKQKNSVKRAFVLVIACYRETSMFVTEDT